MSTLETRTAPHVPRSTAAEDAAALGGGEQASRLLRAAFRRSAAGVWVVTASAPDGSPVGFTATSLASVAAEPAVVSFNIGSSSSSWPVLASAAQVAVHVVGEHQVELAERFARRGADRFAPPTRWHRGVTGVPVLEEVPAWMLCRIVARVPAADHRVVLAEVLEGDASGPGRPLVHHEQRFAALRD